MGSAGGRDQSAISVGRRQHDPACAGELLCSTCVLRLRYEPDDGISSLLQYWRHNLHEPCGFLCAERVRAIRHGGERIRVVLGLVLEQLLFWFARNRSSRTGHRHISGAAGRGVVRQLVHRAGRVPVQQLPGQRGHLLWFSLREGALIPFALWLCSCLSAFAWLWRDLRGGPPSRTRSGTQAGAACSTKPWRRRKPQRLL